MGARRGVVAVLEAQLDHCSMLLGGNRVGFACFKS